MLYLTAFFLSFFIFFPFKVVDMALKMTSLHYQYSGLILTLASQAMTNGYPINRPLWWIDPTDPVAQTIDSGNSRAAVLFPFFFFLILTLENCNM